MISLRGGTVIPVSRAINESPYPDEIPAEDLIDRSRVTQCRIRDTDGKQSDHGQNQIRL